MPKPKKLEGKAVLFACKQFPELTVTMVSEGYREVEGHVLKVPARRIHFQKRAFGGEWRGEYRASDPAEIAFLRAHYYHDNDIIFETPDIDAPSEPDPEGRVVTGARSSGVHEPEPAPPEEAHKPPKKAMVPESLKRRKPALAPAG